MHGDDDPDRAMILIGFMLVALSGAIVGALIVGAVWWTT